MTCFKELELPHPLAEILAADWSRQDHVTLTLASDWSIILTLWSARKFPTIIKIFQSMSPRAAKSILNP